MSAGFDAIMRLIVLLMNKPSAESLPCALPMRDVVIAPPYMAALLGSSELIDKSSGSVEVGGYGCGFVASKVD